MNRRPALPALVLVAALALGGCSESVPSGDLAVINGTVVDSQGEGIPGIEVGALFLFGTTAQQIPAPSGGVRLRPPYPNPNTIGVGVPVTIKVECDRDTTARLEVFAAWAGIPASLVTLKVGAFPAGTTTVSWNGEDRFGRIVPNGLYQVRILVPDPAPSGVTPLVQAQNLLINRPRVLIFPDAVNVESDATGFFTLENLGIGEPFVMTSSTGAVLGNREVAGSVAVFFHDPEAQFADDESRVDLGPREQVSQTFALTPFGSGAPARFAGLAAGPARRP